MAALDEAARRPGVRHVHMMLLAAGRSRHYHTRSSFIEMIRAIGRWSRKRARRQLPAISLYVTDEQVAMDLCLGNFDVLDLLHGREMRFWVETLTQRDHVEREPMYASEHATIGDVARVLHFDLAAWEVEARPNPDRRRGATPASTLRHHTLARLGVVPGSALRFTRRE
jgi:hypothetical protein